MREEQEPEVQATADEGEADRLRIGLKALPGIRPAVGVIVVIDQDGPAGQDGTVDRMLDLIDSVRRSGCDPARLPPRCWREAAYHLMFRHELPPLRAEDLIGSEETTCEGS